MQKFFEIEKTSESKARAGVINTDHGQIQTPIFMPVGTVASVKTVHQRELKEDIKAQIILGNTYHLMLRPTMDIMEKAAGLHQFMNWDLPILTDSGGYQVFSLAKSRKITEEGVKFKSHIDGSLHFMSPEVSMQIQRQIGADIFMAFDECIAYPSDYNAVKTSMELTHRWLKRCITWTEENKELYGHKQRLFPIVQGSCYSDLRKISAEVISEAGAEGNAIGGLSVGEPEPEMYRITNEVTDILPTDKPRYLMGVGTPWNILESIGFGVDMMDCVMPTRNARNAMLFTWQGVMNMKNERWKEDFSPLDEFGTSFVDSAYSKAYVRHLFVSKEYLAKQIASIHNLAFYLDLVKVAREHIVAGDFYQWKDSIIPQLKTRL
ncbi:tRNA guanosine(34) transglycosylase Tgt [Epilithonimonas lactis]|uniref:Queuine tRNA-ribosyltransferase n=1 Tax=Epilithonimonas lactis TaxID=421072 RepID=A0A085BMA7_9FLAO|nr:tRNA guanosine(34) transglycosylase Tgt [Epilithonimonas lactis]KFC23602.1 queuine tRNA-ribosyltransferase [Epilithonimonas lactis]SEQ19021.1 tRNA-guanine transglycosylase [Epilithonimonas lactis]